MERLPSFVRVSLSLSDLSPALRPLNLPGKRAFKAERTRKDGIMTRDHISLRYASLIPSPPPSRLLHAFH